MAIEMTSYNLGLAANGLHDVNHIYRTATAARVTSGT